MRRPRGVGCVALLVPLWICCDSADVSCLYECTSCGWRGTAPQEWKCLLTTCEPQNHTHCGGSECKPVPSCSGAAAAGPGEATFPVVIVIACVGVAAALFASCCLFRHFWLRFICEEKDPGEDKAVEAGAKCEAEDNGFEVAMKELGIQWDDVDTDHSQHVEEHHHSHGDEHKLHRKMDSSNSKHQHKIPHHHHSDSKPDGHREHRDVVDNAVKAANVKREENYVQHMMEQVEHDPKHVPFSREAEAERKEAEQKANPSGDDHKAHGEKSHHHHHSHGQGDSKADAK